MGVNRSYIKLVRSAVENMGRTQVIEASIAFRETIKRSEYLHFYSEGGLGETMQNRFLAGALHDTGNPIYRDEQRTKPTAPQSTLSYLEILEKLSNQQRLGPVKIGCGISFKKNKNIDRNEFSPFPLALEAKRKEYYNRYLSEPSAPKGDWLDFTV